MKSAARRSPRLDRRPVGALLGLVLVTILAGCASTPDIGPFTDATVSLRGAVASAGAATVAELGRTDLPNAQVQAQNLAAAWTERDRFFTALVAYANSLQAIVDAGQSGADAAKAVADASGALAGAANIAMPGAGTGARSRSRPRRSCTARSPRPERPSPLRRLWRRSSPPSRP